MSFLGKLFSFDASGLNGRQGLDRARIKNSGTVVPRMVVDGEYVIVPVTSGFASDPGRRVKFKGTLMAEYFHEYLNYGPEHTALALFKVPGGYRVWGRDTGLRGLNGITDVMTTEELVEEQYSRYWPEIISEFVEDLDNVREEKPELPPKEEVLDEPKVAPYEEPNEKNVVAKILEIAPPKDYDYKDGPPAVRGRGGGGVGGASSINRL